MPSTPTHGRVSKLRVNVPGPGPSSNNTLSSDFRVVLLKYDAN